MKTLITSSGASGPAASSTLVGGQRRRRAPVQGGQVGGMLCQLQTARLLATMESTAGLDMV